MLHARSGPRVKEAAPFRAMCLGGRCRVAVRPGRARRTFGLQARSSAARRLGGACGRGCVAAQGWGQSSRPVRGRLHSLLRSVFLARGPPRPPLPMPCRVLSVRPREWRLRRPRTSLPRGRQTNEAGRQCGICAAAPLFVGRRGTLTLSIISVCCGSTIFDPSWSARRFECEMARSDGSGGKPGKGHGKGGLQGPGPPSCDTLLIQKRPMRRPPVTEAQTPPARRASEARSGAAFQAHFVAVSWNEVSDTHTSQPSSPTALPPGVPSWRPTARSQAPRQCSPGPVTSPRRAARRDPAAGAGADEQQGQARKQPLPSAEPALALFDLRTNICPASPAPTRVSSLSPVLGLQPGQPGPQGRGSLLAA